MVLSASGTACKTIHDIEKPSNMEASTMAVEKDTDKRMKKKKKKKRKKKITDCVFCHIPYDSEKVTGLFGFQKKCQLCKKAFVPDILLCSLCPPPDLQIYSSTFCLIQARVCRKRKRQESRDHAATITSEAIPFIEYDLNNKLTQTMKLKGVNACFNLKTQIILGENMIIAVATGTGILLNPMAGSVSLSKLERRLAIPNNLSSRNGEPPPVPISEGKIVSPSLSSSPSQLQVSPSSSPILKSVGLAPGILSSSVNNTSGQYSSSSLSGSEEISISPINLSSSFSSTEASTESLSIAGDGSPHSEQPHQHFVAMLSESIPESGNSIFIADPPSPPLMNLMNLESHPLIHPIPSSSLQFFCTFFHSRWEKLPKNVDQELTSLFQFLLQQLYFNYFSLEPVVFSDLRFSIQSPEAGDVQVLVTGMCSSVESWKSHETAEKLSSLSRNIPSSSSPLSLSLAESKQSVQWSEDQIFELEKEFEELFDPDLSRDQSSPTFVTKFDHHHHTPTQASLMNDLISHFDKMVEITAQSSVPNGKIKRHVGRFSYHLIREHQIKEDETSMPVHEFLAQALSIGMFFGCLFQKKKTIICY